MPKRPVGGPLLGNHPDSIEQNGGKHNDLPRIHKSERSCGLAIFLGAFPLLFRLAPSTEPAVRSVSFIFSSLTIFIHVVGTAGELPPPAVVHVVVIIARLLPVFFAVVLVVLILVLLHPDGPGKARNQNGGDATPKPSHKEKGIGAVSDDSELNNNHAVVNHVDLNL
jgi:hypothetical protein